MSEESNGTKKSILLNLQIALSCTIGTRGGSKVSILFHLLIVRDHRLVEMSMIAHFVPISLKFLVLERESQ